MIDLLPQIKALADETRLRLLNILVRHELNVNELVAILGMGQSRISRHLKILADSGLAQSRRDGLWVFYRAVDNGSGRELIDALKPFMAEAGLRQDLSRAAEVVDDRQKATKQFFDAIAGDWDRRSREMLGDLDLAEEITRRMPMSRVAVDLGCGTGEILASMLAKAESVIGVDNAPAMLARARQRFAGNGEDVSLRIGELHHLPLRDQEVDFALISMALHHLVKPQDALMEAYRVLGPGGNFLVVDLTRHDVEAMRSDQGDRWLGFDPEELTTWLNKAGFSIQDSVFFPVNNGLTVQMQLARKSE
ncbi:MAG: methyltransferase domain-containing protein [Desulfovibrio sp.]|nr:MAG: methyltransferase domain-containing protein [Desulfovibrio sp.]